MNKIENAVIKYQIDFEKYKNGCANEVISLLDKTNKEIAKYIKLTKDISTKKRYTEIARKLKDIAKTLRDGVDKSTDIDALIEYELIKRLNPSMILFFTYRNEKDDGIVKYINIKNQKKFIH